MASSRAATLNRSASSQQAALSAKEVATYLREQPRFLAEHPELYRRLTPPERVHGEALADHMAAMLRAERAHAAAMTERAELLLTAGRAAAGLAARVQDAVLALIAAADAAECVTAELPAILAVDAACLLSEGSVHGARRLPPGSVARLLGTRSALFRSNGGDAALLHAEAASLARRDALVRVPGAGPPTLLALAARDDHALDPAQGIAALAFLGRAIAAALGR